MLPHHFTHEPLTYFQLLLVAWNSVFIVRAMPCMWPVIHHYIVLCCAVAGEKNGQLKVLWHIFNSFASPCDNYLVFFNVKTWPRGNATGPVSKLCGTATWALLHAFSLSVPCSEVTQSSRSLTEALIWKSRYTMKLQSTAVSCYKKSNYKTVCSITI